MSESLERAELLDRIVDLQVHIAQLFDGERARDWLDVDLTIQQLKVVFLAVRMGSLTAGQISRELRVGFSTVTGLVDRLAEQGFVSRGEDPNDRRATRVAPTEAARALVERLYSYRRAEFRRMLDAATDDTLSALETGLRGLEQAAEELYMARPVRAVADPQ